MSPMIARASENRPPAPPMPWKARKAASMYIDVDSVQSAEPAMKTAMAKMKNGLRPYWSDSLP